MACAFLLTTLILLAAAAATNPYGGPTYRSLKVSGAICCSPAGVCVRGSHPISGAQVSLYCNRASGGSAVKVGSTATTDVNGRFTISATYSKELLPFTQSYISCIPIVWLPHNAKNCPLLSTLLFGILGQAHAVSHERQIRVELKGAVSTGTSSTPITGLIGTIVGGNGTGGIGPNGTDIAFCVIPLNIFPFCLRFVDR